MIAISKRLSMAARSLTMFAYGTVTLMAASAVHAQLLDTPATSTISKLLDARKLTSLEDYAVHDDALLLLASHIVAIGTPWTALRVQGTVALPGASESVPATLLLQNLNQAILILNQPSGLQAIEIEGAFRKSIYSDGKLVVDPSPAGVAGLLPLALLHSSLLSPNLLAMKAEGKADVQGVSCDKLSLRLLLTKGVPAKTAKPHNVQIDYYLDSKTHLLAKSVLAVQVPGIATPRLQETYYGSYKSFLGIQFPQRITQTIGDAPLWDLTVTSLTPETKIASKEFTR